MNKMIGKTLTQLRMERHLTQSEVEVALGMGPRTLSKYENGSRTITTDILMMFSDFYNVSVHYLLEEFPDDSWGKIQNEAALNLLNELPVHEQRLILLNIINNWEHHFGDLDLQKSKVESRVLSYYSSLKSTLK